MAMDIVWNCTFGIDVDVINNKKFVYFVKVRELIDIASNFEIFAKLTTYFYEFKPVFVISSLLSSFVASKLNLNWGNPFFWLFDRVHEIIDEKVKENKMGLKKKHDYVQLLIDAEADSVNLDFDNQHYDSGNMKILEKKMTQSEIFASLIGFMIAGYETTASTINFCLYFLLTHPEELSKLQEEVDSLQNYDYESLNQLEYLDMFIKEVLRMHPVGVSVQNRRCTKATTLKGIDIPEGLQITVDVLSLHYNPEYWPDVDPNIFYPLRFAPDATYNKLAYMPFGAGARICIGMRFALLEIKLTLAKILRTFNISTEQKLPKDDLKIRDGFLFGVHRIREPIFINFTSRR